MKTLKLVIGILCFVLAAFIIFQSCAAGLSNALENNDEGSGMAGFMVALLMIAGGAVMIATRNGGKGGSIAGLIIYLIAGLLGLSMAGSFGDLKVWGGLCLVIAIINLIAIFTAKKAK